MVIIGLRLPSGWQGVEDTIKKLENSHDLRRYELNENKLNLYFDEVIFHNIFFSFISKINKKKKLTVKGKNFEIEAKKIFDIKDIKPGQIYVYDYYEPIGK